MRPSAHSHEDDRVSGALPRNVMPDEGKRIRLYAVRFRLLVESQGAGGTLAILVTEIPSGTS